MTTDQLAILAEAPKLTPRQQVVMDALTRAGHDGIAPGAAGAILHELKEGRWAHGRDERCDFCSRDGLSVLKALRKKGLARYRAKLKVWQATGDLEPGKLPPGMTTEIPF